MIDKKQLRKIVKYLDGYLNNSNRKTINPVFANRLLQNAGLLNDSKNRPGLPLRKLLNAYRIPHAYQDNKRHWFIPHSNEVIEGSLKHKIQEIGFEINNKVKENDNRISLLQKLRADKYKLDKISKTPFNLKGIKGRYAFHNGGIKELQFNYGLERIDGQNFFRYGVAFNLRRGQSLHYPMEVFSNKIKSYNKFYKAQKDFFNNLSMWYYDFYENKYSLGRPKLIDKVIGKEGNFIFIGKIIKKDPLKINKNDTLEVISLFNELMPLYEFVELGVTNKVESQIARICWNNNLGWIKPSGRLGKATTDSHEKKYGFGHEEWLFNKSRVIEGLQYGFLEPIRKFQKKYEGRKFNLFLYTRNSVERKNYWVGNLKGVEVLNQKQAEIAVGKFKQRGVLDEMKSQLSAKGLNGEKLINEYMNETDLINIRFKISEIENIFEKPIPVSENDSRISSLRYVMLPWNGNLEIDELIETSGDYFLTGNKGKRKLKGKAKANYKSKSKDIDLTHNLISDGMMDYLIYQFGEDNVRRECKVNGNYRIDIVVRKNGGDIFYEIKTYPHLITCLRQALGQLIEYSCYPDKNRAKHFYLVSDIKAKPKFINYLKHLNKLFNINLGYICFDLDKGKIVQTV